MASISSQAAVLDAIELQPVEAQTIHDTPPANAALAFAEGDYPEGGRQAWCAVAGSAITFWWFIGIMYSWGIIQDALIEAQVGSPAVIATIGSLGAGLEVFLSVPASKICARLGNQKTAFIGSSLVGLGLVLTSFCTHSVAGLFICMGFIYGTGTALCLMAAGPLPAQYFHRYRGIATGITFGSGGFGGAAITLLLSTLNQHYGLPWAVRTVGLLTLLCCLPASYIMKPRFTGKDAGILNFALFRDIQFNLLLACGFLSMFPIFVVPYFIPQFARAIDLTDSTAAWLLAGYNLSSAFGRIGFGFICDSFLGPINSLLAAQATMALSLMVVWSVTRTLGPLILFVVINGIAAGGFFSLFGLVVASLFKSSPVATSYGMLLSSWSFGYLTGGPLSGFIIDTTGGTKDFRAYRPAILFAGGLATTAAALLAMVRYRAANRLLVKV